MMIPIFHNKMKSRKERSGFTASKGDRNVLLREIGKRNWLGEKI